MCGGRDEGNLVHDVKCRHLDDSVLNYDKLNADN